MKKTLYSRMKKTLATVLIVFFVMILVTGITREIRVVGQQGSHAYTAEALDRLVGLYYELAALLPVLMGLYYSTRWLMKLSGHSYKLGQQTWAALLFWYSALAVLLGLTLSFGERNTTVLTIGAVMLVVWLSVAYACWRWRRSLRRQEKEQQSQPATP